MFRSTGVTGTKLNSNSQGSKILSYIINNEGATKYECVTNVLGKSGSKRDLRGYYSVYFQGLVDNGLVSYNRSTRKYHITALGLARYVVSTTR